MTQNGKEVVNHKIMHLHRYLAQNFKSQACLDFFAISEIVIQTIHAPQNEVESACKPGSVEDDHSSRPTVADGLKQPTRVPRGPRVWTPIWSCFEWGLPYRSVARLVVRSYRTVSPLPDLSRTRYGQLGSTLSVACAPDKCPASCSGLVRESHRRSALCCTFRRLAPPRRYLALCPVKPGLSSPMHAWQRSPSRLRRAA